jgi:HPr kinase/phosphorylase
MGIVKGAKLMFDILSFANHFGLKTYYTSVKASKRVFTVIEVDRPGLEMAGFFEYHQKSRLVLIGKKEVSYLAHMTYENAYEVFLNICGDETPGLIICHDVQCPKVIIDAAKAKDCSVYGTEAETSTFEADALNYLCEKLAPHISIHANCLRIFDEGVLIIGDSGIGKSEVSLDLIKRGHTFVADDRVEISNVRNQLIAEAPEIIYGMMEVRGVGIIDITRTFSINSLKKRSTIKYIINLIHFDPSKPVDRLGNQIQYKEILNVPIQEIVIPVSPGRSIAEVIEVAITNLKLKEYGFDSAYELEKKLTEFRNRKKDK